MKATSVAGLLLALQESPADPLARSAYADWLEETGGEDQEWHRALADATRNPDPDRLAVARSVWDEFKMEGAPQATLACQLALACGLNSRYAALASWLLGRDQHPFPRNGKLVRGYLTTIYPANADAMVADATPDPLTGEDRPLFYGWHGNDIPPCRGEWVGDANDTGSWVLADTPLTLADLPEGWMISWRSTDPVAPQEWARHYHPGWILAADGAGRTYLIDCDPRGICTLLLDY